MLFVIFSVFTTPLLAQQPDLGTEQQRAAGKALYDEKCAQCHGENGDGLGVAAQFFKPLPRDFTQGQLKIRTTGSGELPTDKDLKDIIKKGMPYTGMPAWPNLSDQQLANLVYYIKTFSDAFADPDYLPEPLDFPEAPAFSEESAQKGREVFEKNECIACHGNYGRGDGASAKDIVDDKGNHIRPADMTKRWTYRGGGTREDIYRTFTTGINGTPMPSYSGLISPEDQWYLVDYVYSLSRDEPDYSTIVISKPYLDGQIDISKGKALFAGADSAYFAIVGQVVEPGREYFPGVNGIYVKAVHDTSDIAMMLSWNDMSAERSGSNSPDIVVEETSAVQEVTVEDDPFADFEEEEEDPFADPFADVAEGAVEEGHSDAVAIQFPTKMPEGQVKPYLLFGDRRNPVDLWYTDLAGSAAQVWIGKGSDNLAVDSTQTLEMTANFQDGEWTVIFKRKRRSGVENGLSFADGTFLPIAFTVWDGFNKERGNKRGLSSWYYLYIEPMQKESAVWPMMKVAFWVIIVELLLIGWVRRRHRKSRPATTPEAVAVN
jgi:cbb3-type cytochrome c oxidase subunit III